MENELSERKQKILAAIVEQYIRSGEPIGSKSLMEVLPMKVSSATIRNEMAELAALGLLEQPHTSAGRIPSHSGYRYYIDHLMHARELDDDSRRKIEAAIGEGGDPEHLLSKAGEVLADLTNCAAVSTTPAGESTKIRRIEMVPVGSRTAMLVLLTSTGILKSRICRVDTSITVPLLERFYNVTASQLVGRALADVHTTAMQTLAASLGADAFSLLPLLAAVAELARDAAQADIRLDGQSNLLGYRELEENAYELMEFLRNGEPLNALISSNKEDVHVLIGKENRFRQLSNSSLILARYDVGGEESGTLGVIGPTRLDYAKLIPSVRYLTDLVGRLLTRSMHDEE
ncbi:MAG: heat-inducible transcription repressor HrcA [Clostridia bacterium]|nr:heat-inducible transcription repressor HrcA [Clostridia bacterium]